MKKKIEYDFNLIADDYNKHHSAHSNFTEIIKFYSDISESSNIIDVGCGTGNETINLFRSFNCNVFGIEPAIDMINIGRNKENRVFWKVGNAENLSIKNKFADIITCFFSIHHFNDIYLSFKEFSRVLKTNGIIFIFSISHSQMQSSLEYRFFPELLSADLTRVPTISNLIKSLELFDFLTTTIETEYETRKIDENYLDMVKNQYRSGLRLLNQNQLNFGIKQIEESIKNNEQLVDKINCTVIIAQKQ